MKRLDLVVGCNGAGKSTFVEHVLLPILPRSRFINADVIALEQWPHDPVSHSYEAARIAEAIRDEMITRGRSLIAETVFSHPSKLALIRRAFASDYFVALHVLMIPEDLAVARVAHRVQAGGHHVPEDKIRGRYRRLWDHVDTALDLVDEATVYDNSSNVTGLRVVARTYGGTMLEAPDWPSWTPVPLARRGAGTVN